MKKIIFLFALMAMFTMASAQTVVRNGVFSNMYVGLSGGAQHNPVSNYDYFDVKDLNYNAALEIGKDVTPVTGFSLTGYAMPTFDEGFNLVATNVTGNTKFNLMNLFGGYKGYPRRVEIKTVTGIGWDHTFMDETPAEPEREAVNPNDMSLNAGLEFDFNLGKNRAWYITFTPQVIAHNVIRNYQDIQPLVKNADVQANLGVAYRFGSKKTGSHNFVICDKAYTEEQYAELYNLYDECMNRPAEVDTVTVVLTQYVEKPVEIGYVTECITFDKNSDVIKDTEMQRLDLYMHSMSKDIDYVVCGSADTGTGTKDLNNNLAQRRADAVAKILRENGFNVETVVKLDALDVTELSRCAIITKK